jgi:hypothetical protein
MKIQANGVPVVKVRSFVRRSNTLLKLAAPVPNDYRSCPAVRYGRTPFVNSPVRRRSLSAIR